MPHPLETVIQEADGFVLIGDSSQGRFPATSYASYTQVGKRFYCLDLGGLPVARGPAAGGKVYQTIDQLPADRSDLAIIWIHPHSAARAVEVAHQAGCKRVWFSFQTGHRDGVQRARELGMEVVEIGRCPVYYMDRMSKVCAAHTLLMRATGGYGKPPQVDPAKKRREMW